MDAAYERLRSAWDRRGGLTLAERLDALKSLRSALREKAGAFAEALNQDFRGRSRHESLLTEIAVAISAIDFTIPRVARWARPTKVCLEFPHWPAKARLLKQPRGVAGILGPSNYPLQLVLMPLIGALSAGCRTLLKPSEAMPAVAELFRSTLRDAIDPDSARVLCGGPEVSAAMVELPLDVLLFTGSHGVGLKVAAAAAKRLTPVVLELGGKSPAIIDRSANPRRAAETLIRGKLLNAGQTCVAPDYLLAPRESIDELIAHLRDAARRLYPDPVERDYTAIRSDAAWERLRELESGQSTEALFDVELKPPHYSPKIVLAPSLDSAIMREEIFGPLLPILAYDEIADAAAVVKSLPSPLVLYWFGDSNSRLQQVVRSTSSGAVSVNETVLHAGISSLPLGGVGASGLGRYHGRAGFEAFSHERAYFQQSRLNITGMMRPPYGRTADRILNWLLR
jgi:coniferyl-aldehyde dehydrogenase